MQHRTPSSLCRTGASIEKMNVPFLFGDKRTPTEYAADLERAIALGWSSLHESATYVKFADLFA
jgi:hypothetical protein